MVRKNSFRKAVAFGAALCLAGCAQPATGPAVGASATFSYKATDGREVTPETVRGHIVVLDFWATWCAPCIESAPHIVELNHAYAGKGVEIIGVSLDEDVKAMEAWAKEHDFTWPQICDGKAWGSAAVRQWGVISIPQSVILSPDWTVLWRGKTAEMDGPLQDAVAKYRLGG